MWSVPLLAFVACHYRSLSSPLTVSMTMPRKTKTDDGPSRLLGASGTPRCAHDLSKACRFSSHVLEAGGPIVKKSSR